MIGVSGEGMEASKSQERHVGKIVNDNKIQKAKMRMYYISLYYIIIIKIIKKDIRECQIETIA